MGSVAILNVGAGDTRLSFDKSNPAECIRAARIVRDMIRRGYALLIEVERDGVKAFERALDFREDTCEYVIADFDPVTAYQVRMAEKAKVASDQEKEQVHGEGSETATGISDVSAEAGDGEKKARGRRRNIPASGTRAVAVSRSAGG